MRSESHHKGTQDTKKGPWVLCALCVFVVTLPSVHAEVIERILAVVDGRPLTLTEVDLLARVLGLDLAAAAEALIDERLMFREASRLPQAAVSAEEEERAYRSLLERFPSGSAGASEEELRRLARREAAILKYVEYRFRSQVRLQDEAVRRAYEEEYAGIDGSPAFDAVAPEIRGRLARKELDEKIEAWVKELRSSAEIRRNAP